MYCPKCGKEMREDDTFCSACGNKIESVSVASKESKKKNVGIVFLLVSLVIQVVAIIGSFASNSFGNAMAFVLFGSFALVLISSILCIVKSKNATKHKGRALGIVFTVFSGIAVVTIALGVVFGDSTASKTNIEMQNTADEAIEILKDCLKSPQSLYLNSVVVEVKSSKTKMIIDGVEQNKDEPFSGTYIVYIDYSAENSLGGATRSYFKVVYYVSGTDKKLMDASEISSIPQLKGTIYEIDKNKLRSYSDMIR